MKTNVTEILSQFYRFPDFFRIRADGWVVEPLAASHTKLRAVVNVETESEKMSCGGSIGQRVSVEEQRSYWPQWADLRKNNDCH